MRMVGRRLGGVRAAAPERSQLDWASAESSDHHRQWMSWEILGVGASCQPAAV